MAENKRVVLVGIPGVGKTTLLKMVVDKLRAQNKIVLVRSFGTVMLEVARSMGITDRDALRQLPTEEQSRLQNMAARKLAEEPGDIVIIDTHAFVSTVSGYYPGLPERVLRVLNPTIYISVSAKPEEIYNRRKNDPTRHRDRVNIANIKQELDIQAALVSTYSVVSGSPVKPIVNRDDRMDAAAAEVIKVLGL